MYTLSDKKLIMLRPKDIKPSSAVPRREFDEYELKLLTDSIQASGIIEPNSAQSARLAVVISTSASASGINPCWLANISSTSPPSTPKRETVRVSHSLYVIS